MFYPLLSFVARFLRRKSMKHVESPIVRAFCEEILYADMQESVFQEIEHLRVLLKNDSRSFYFTDRGTGRSGRMRVKDIARSAPLSSKQGRLLYRVASLSKPATIVELGTSLGIGTAYLAKGAKEAEVFSIEGCPEVSALAFENLQKLNCKQVKLMQGDISECLPGLLANINSPILVYFDANHAYTPTMKYFHLLLPYACENSIFMFDDIHWSSGMAKAWKEITHAPEVSASIDLFQLGIVFFNKSESKTCYSLRF
jgi:predicted O-methyltransferase YrrM